MSALKHVLTESGHDGKQLLGCKRKLVERCTAWETRALAAAFSTPLVNLDDLVKELVGSFSP